MTHYPTPYGNRIQSGHLLAVYHGPITQYVRSLVPNATWAYEFNPSVVAVEFVTGFLNGGMDSVYFDGFLTSLIESMPVIPSQDPQDAYWQTYFDLVQHFHEIENFTRLHLCSLGFNPTHLAHHLTKVYGYEVYWSLEQTHTLHCFYSMVTE